MPFNPARLRDIARRGGFGVTLVRSVVGVGGFQGISILSRLAGSFILARFLGPAGYGQYALIITVILMLSLPIGPGMSEFLTREVASYQQSGQWQLLHGLIRRATQTVVIFSLLLYLGLGALSTSQAMCQMGIQRPMLLIGLACLPFIALAFLCAGIVRGFGHVVAAQAPHLVIQPASNLLAIAGFLILGWLTPITAMIGRYFASATACFFGFLILRKVGLSNTTKAKPHFETSRWVSVWISFSLLAGVRDLTNQTGTLMIGWLGTNADVGFFQVAQRISQIIDMPLMIICMVIAPYITRAYRNGQQERLQKIATQTTRGVLGFAFLLSLPIIFFAGPLLNVTFGSAYAKSATLPLDILVFAQLFNASLGPVGILLIMSGHERLNITGQSIAVILNAGICLLLVPEKGAVGAAYGGAVSIVVFNIIMSYLVHKHLKLRPSIF